VSSSIT